MSRSRKFSWIELVRAADKEAMEPFNDDYGRDRFIPPNRAKKNGNTKDRTVYIPRSANR